MCPPVNIHCHGLYYALCAEAHTRARIHSLFLTLTRGKIMFSYNQILINPKSYGLVHDVCVKKICVRCTVFADALI